AAIFAVFGAAVFLAWNSRQETARLVSTAPWVSYEIQDIPLESLAVDPSRQLTTPKVAVNGQLRVGEGIILTPSLQPSVPQPGQMYYDRGANMLGYFNGTEYVFLDPGQVALQPGTIVEQISGLTGN